MIDAYSKTTEMFSISDFSRSPEFCDNIQITPFMQLLKSKWDDICKQPDIFRYKIDKLQERVENGKYLLQLNPDRAVKRRTPDQIDNIRQEFDENKFHFKKVSPKEILFFLGNGENDSNKHMLLVNVSPISRYHSLLCPSIDKCLPQVVTADSLQLAINIILLAQDRDLRIGFNSLCAFASVNHLHYHLLVEKATLPVETVEWIHVKGPLYRLADHYPVPGFCFEAQKPTAAIDIYKLLEHLLNNSIAHNILITGKRMALLQKDENVASVIIWPRKRTSGVKQLTAFNVAICELSGWFPIYNEQAFATVGGENLEIELGKWKIDNFEKLCKEVESLY